MEAMVASDCVNGCCMFIKCLQCAGGTVCGLLRERCGNRLVVNGISVAHASLVPLFKILPGPRRGS